MKHQSEKTSVQSGKKLLTSKEAAAYLGIDYCNFRKQRNKGYFGKDKYPAPKFIYIGESFQGIRYRVTDLDKWLSGYPVNISNQQLFKERPDKQKR